MREQRREPGIAQGIETFTLDQWRVDIVEHYRAVGLEDEIRRLIDPAAAEETVHWGRNYLYRTRFTTANGPITVVVKQFRNQDLRSRLRRRWREGKGERSWRAAHWFQAAGIGTAEPIALIDSRHLDGPTFFVSRCLEHVIEARYLFRAANRGRVAETFPHVDFERFLRTLGSELRRMHDAGLFHRDLSIGNVLLATSGPESGRLYIIDLNRARRKRRLGLSQRTRDLCRLAIFAVEHQRIFLDAYWGEDGVGALRTAVYRLYHGGFSLKIETKKKLRRFGTTLRQWILPRRAHAHIPEAPTGASARDKIVWDHLSDQPHQHAGRLEKLAVRIADGPSHMRQTVTCLAALPRIWQRYRQLRSQLYHRPVAWDGVGLALRPLPEAPEALLEAIEQLGVRRLLLRLHPWEGCYEAEEELSRELNRRGYELAFALPQNRDLVRDTGRWRAQIEEIAERFTPYGCHFQVGQAINRSKWGIWSYCEYAELAGSAVEILRRRSGVEILGPAVIDFEFQATAAVLNLRHSGLDFDAVASLLYVDRRGAPENPQLGFDTVDKVVLLKAIADTARNSAPRSWITEFNWPLWEGPHSPAGRSVSVDETKQAEYLARYYLLTLTTGLVERVYWWQLVARGYGLIAVGDGCHLRRRPSFQALATLVRELAETDFVRPLTAPEGTRLYLFRRHRGGEVVVGWSLGGRCSTELPRPASALTEIDGATSTGDFIRIDLLPAVRYFELKDSPATDAEPTTD